ncbi:hypothetical protein V6N13_059821 [Hibiscus sabdariffa]|uniref:Uncharacterized protein n=1 Tax=Hibiscus sabdariffa TaxID=183260 RepID=A0ABR2GC03_9ROSI
MVVVDQLKATTTAFFKSSNRHVILKVKCWPYCLSDDVKTTLLITLWDRLTGGLLNGTITYNDKPFSNLMKRKNGFVAQDDVLHPRLTVTETLVFTALLRLPNSFSLEE